MESLILPGTRDSLKAVSDFVVSAATEAGLGKKAVYGLRLAVDEIATNIVMHGYVESKQEGDLDLRAEIDRKTLTITIEDTGPAYDPSAKATPPESITMPPKDREIGGLGVYLALKSVDGFSYERVGNRNRNVFVMNRPEASPT